MKYTVQVRNRAGKYLTIDKTADKTAALAKARRAKGIVLDESNKRVRA